MTKIAFIDLEASGLGSLSWPIEVGWCFDSGEPETFLIKPDKGWPLDAWDENAEALHGIAMETLTASGISAAKICAQLNSALDGVSVYSDAPDWDGFWLYRLFAAAKMRQKFKLFDFGSLLSALPPEKIEAAVKKASQLTPHQHRARNDVLHMRAIYVLAAA